MSLIQTDIAEARAADPALLLRALKATESYAGKSVVIFDPSASSTPWQSLFNQLAARAETNTDFKDIIHELGRRARDEELHDSTRSFFESPVYYYGGKNHKDSKAAVIIAPRDDFDFLKETGFRRDSSTELLSDDEKNVFLYLIVQHELAHTQSFSEAYADSTAIMFTRRAFPDSIAPAVMNDMRALCILNRAMLSSNIALRIFSNIGEELRKYNWDMVTANDSALSIPADEIAKMDDASILKKNFSANTANNHRALHTVARLLVRNQEWFKTNPLRKGALSRSISEIAESASKLANDIQNQTPDLSAISIAKRFALATRRLTEGAAAYAQYAAPIKAPNPT